MLKETMVNFDTRKYYIDTKITSDISRSVYENVNNYSWSTGELEDQFQVNKLDENGKYIGVDQSLITQDSLLKLIHPYARGELNLFRVPPNTVYNWHTDENNKVNINLIFEECPMGFSMFNLEKGDYDESTIHRSLRPVLTVPYTPNCWLIYNAQIEHTVLNLSDKFRYLLTYTIKNINYRAVVKILKL